MHKTDRYLRVEAALGDPLGPWLAEQVKAGRSYTRLADDLRAITSITVSHETLRAWHAAYLDDQVAADATS